MKSELEPLGIPNAVRASLILEGVCGEIPRISAPAFRFERKNEITDLVDISI
jgi:hypothetical protein